MEQDGFETRPYVIPAGGSDRLTTSRADRYRGLVVGGLGFPDPADQFVVVVTGLI